MQVPGFMAAKGSVRRCMVKEKKLLGRQIALTYVVDEWMRACVPTCVCVCVCTYWSV